MKQLLHYFSTTRKDLRILLLIAIFLYILIEIIFKNFPELFNGGYEIGQFFSKLSMSYISSFIFYFIVVHIKNQKDKENINEWVGHKAYSIITCTHLLIQPIMQLKDEKAKFEDLNSSDLDELLKSINRLDHNAPYIINNKSATWLSWYEYLKDSMETSISEIFRRYIHLDSDLIKILSRIENSLFFQQWDFLHTDKHDPTFGMYKIQIISFLNLINDLEKYCDKNLQKYRHRTSITIGLKTPFHKNFE